MTQIGLWDGASESRRKILRLSLQGKSFALYKNSSKPSVQNKKSKFSKNEKIQENTKSKNDDIRETFHMSSSLS